MAAELQGRVKAIERDIRMAHLGTAQRYLKSFLEMLEQYEVVPTTERELYELRSGSVKDPAKRRELKIKQYQKEKELRTRIEVSIASNSILIFYHICHTIGRKKTPQTIAYFRCRYQRLRSNFIATPLAFAHSS